MTTRLDQIGVFGDVALETSAAIGSRIVQDAIWSSDRCTWVGAEPMERIRDGRQGSGSMTRLTYRALGPDLYAGSSGVGLYLAELGALTGHDNTRRTAIGAMRHALSRCEDIEPSMRRGFFVGWSGIAIAATRAGLLLHDSELVERGSCLLDDVARDIERSVIQSAADHSSEPVDEQEFDLIAGTAGAVLALLDGHRLFGADDLLAAASAAAEQLLQSAVRHDFGWSWTTPQLRNRHDLTGLSHGAAGVATSLIEAHRATGDRAFATGAIEAMRYENHWFDQRAGNWPDFRQNVGGGNTHRVPMTFATLWCHGAPGIALARMHANRHLGEQRWLDDAEIALHTTIAETATQVTSSGSNFSLCHGLAGNAECILESSRQASTAMIDVPVRVAEFGIANYAGTDTPWPCGTHTDETPNLMLGLAGIGHFYLRWASPEVPSILFPVGIVDPAPEAPIYKDVET